MKLLLLEQNKDKKGTLLETIVKVLLSSYGYDYVATNEIGSGGNEIDVEFCHLCLLSRCHRAA